MGNDSGGHTVIELVIAMALATLLMTAIYQTHQIRQKSHVRQELAVEMQQNIRAVISLMKREIRMAGYDPAANDGQDNDNDTIIDNVEESAGTGVHVAGRSTIQISFDNDADRKIAPRERITYSFAKAYDADGDGIADDGAAPVGRRSGSDSLMPVAEHIQAVGFAYAFDSDNDGILNTDDGTADGDIIWAYDSDISDENDQLTTDLATGSPLVEPVALSDVRAVRIWILARTRTPVRNHFDDRTYMVGDRRITSADRYPRRLIRTTVHCRNMQL